MMLKRKIKITKKNNSREYTCWKINELVLIVRIKINEHKQFSQVKLAWLVRLHCGQEGLKERFVVFSTLRFEEVCENWSKFSL